MITNIPANQLTCEDTLNGIQITWQGKKNWGLFAGTVFSILINLFVFGILIYYVLTGFFGGMPNQTITVVVIIALGAYALYRVYRRIKDLIGSLLDHELILINAEAVSIKRSGFLQVEREVTYPGDRIQAIRSTFHGTTRFFFLSFTVGGDFLTKSRLSGDQIFCRGISNPDAEATLAKIYERFPQYRDIKP